MTTLEEALFTPWPALDKNTQTAYVPELMEAYRTQSLFYRMVPHFVRMDAMRSTQVVLTRAIYPPPNTEELDARVLFLPQLYMDSAQIYVTARRYGGKVQVHKYDDMITYWRQNGEEGLKAIVRRLVAPNMINTMDILARNAFLRLPQIAFAGGASDFGSLGPDHKFDPDIVRQVWMNAQYAGTERDSIIAVVAPSAVYTLRSDDTGEFISRLQYADPERIALNYEVGTYEGARFVGSPLMTLWNCGAITTQTTITASVKPGDGSPNPDVSVVDGVWHVGQSGATHYITVANSSGFAIGDYVTLHRNRASTNSKMAVQNGVIWDDPHNLHRRVVDVQTGKLVLDEPVTTDWFQTDLGGGAYGYVTKARNIHASLFIWGENVVAGAVLQPPLLHQPPPIDDTEAVFRFSWDFYGGYTPYNVKGGLVYFHTGPVAVSGNIIQP